LHDCGAFVLQYVDDLTKDIYNITNEITVSIIVYHSMDLDLMLSGLMTLQTKEMN